MPGNKRSAGANMVPSRQQRPRYETRSRHQGAEPTNGESEVMRGRGRARSRGCGRRSVSRGRGGLGRGRHCQRNLRDLPAHSLLQCYWCI